MEKELEYELAHIGINCTDAETSRAVCEQFSRAFGFPVKEGNSSNFASGGIEVMKSPYLGTKGHIAIRTKDVAAAVRDLESKGFAVDTATAKEKDGRLSAIYLKDEFGGFAVHLLQA